MKKHLQYLWYLARHKFFVFRAGLVTKAPLWRLIIHDWSKFLPCEWFPYAEHFYGKDRKKPNRPGAGDFKKAWLHHIHRNPHHWNHWVTVDATNKINALPMPEKFIREMVADWLGAGRAITGEWDIYPWFDAHQANLILHPGTRMRVYELLDEVQPRPTKVTSISTGK